MPNSDNETADVKIARLVKRRGGLKGNLTRFATYFDSIKDTAADEKTLSQLEMRISSIEANLLINFADIQFQLENLDCVNFNDTDTKQFEDTYYDVLSDAKNYLSKQKLCNNSSAISSNSPVPSVTDPAPRKPSVKLPTIELPKFSGVSEQWIEFRDLFVSLIHNNTDMEPIQKFHYLRASLVGSAIQCIKAIDFLGENYDLAWDTMCKRFNNKQLLVDSHIKAFFKFKELKSDPQGFRGTVDSILIHLNSLINLGVEKTDLLELFIIHLISSKFDHESIAEWEKTDSQGDLPSLQEFLNFMTDRADYLEKVNKHRLKSKDNVNVQKQKAFVVQSESNVNKKTFCCFNCKKPHSIFKCKAFLSLNINNRKKRVSELQLCTNCLQPSHSVEKCNYGHCRFCPEKHNSTLHDNSVSLNSIALSPQPEFSDQQGQAHSLQSYGCYALGTGQVLLSTALVGVLDAHGNKHTCRALLDNGSMSNFITQRCAQRLGLPLSKIEHVVTGVGQGQSFIKASCNIHFHSLVSRWSSIIHCLVIPEITNQLPNYYFNPTLLNIPSNIILADSAFYKPHDIDLLIGADTFWSLLNENRKHLGKELPVLQDSKLGWLISGRIGMGTSKATSCNVSRTGEVQDQLAKFWEIEEISQGPTFSVEETLAEEHFQKTFQRDKCGRFIVSIPLKEPIAKLGKTEVSCKKQFFSLERRLSSNPKLKGMYVDFMSEYENLGHMSKFQRSSEDQVLFYTPHHGVVRDQSQTTKLRVVFNGSALSSTGLSYNSIQMVGPVVQDDLTSILLRFRQHRYVFSADICKMYRQILVDKEFRPLQLILWRDSPDKELQTFSLNTVTYGTASAPFLATRCLKQLGLDNKESFPEASQVILHDFYVDDILSGADSTSEAIQLADQVAEILKSGCFDLRKWKSNSLDILKGIKPSHTSEDSFHFGPTDTSKTLGMLWSPDKDYFSFIIEPSLDVEKITKRVMLSDIARIFDPLGLLGPVVIKAKIWLQTLWSLKLTWDQNIPLELCNKWKHFRKELNNLRQVEIRRNVVCPNPILIELHGFSDASQSAYGACVYVKSSNLDGEVQVNLVTSKTRVAPLKSLSIPRLELCAAVLLAKLVEKVKSSLTIHFYDTFLWSDSTVVLAWIRSSPHTLQTFVANRVTEIQNLSDSNRVTWRYVPTDSNPADILSRGVSPGNLVNSDIWFHGPEWLYSESTFWPSDISLQNPIPMDLLPEVRLQSKSFVQTQPADLFPFNRFSSLIRIKRTMAYCLRFINNCKLKRELRFSESLTVEELNNAMKRLVIMAQKESFQRDWDDLEKSRCVSRKSKLLSLTPFLDGQMIRVGGRLKFSSYSFEKRHPALLSPKHHLTYLIMRHEHINLLHCGPQALLAHVREQYWPVAGSNLAKKIVRQCIVCYRFKPRNLNPIMGNLPNARINPSFPFTNTGVDYAGPFMIKDRKGRGCKHTKCYLALFVCLVTKAVHLEVVSSLSTESFLETLQRFIARRGKPSHIYSDNGSNFVGANNTLRELSLFLKSSGTSLIDKIGNTHDIKWHFIPAYSPHQGGLWEAGVKSAKHHIKRVLVNTILTFESFYTVITQIESILNSRPLAPLSTDPNDLEVLTPAHFLIGHSLLSVPFPNYQHISVTRLSHFQQLELLKQHFWNRWSKEYLSQIQQRSKWKTPQRQISIGTLVLIRDDDVPHYKWRLGRIVNIHPGKDEVIRVVSVKTKLGVIKRPIVKVCPLPLCDE